MHINELKHRLKNAATAAFGAAGIAMINLYRTAQEMEYVASSFKILKMSSLFGVVAGAIWFFMPQAKDNTHEETVNATKEVVKEPLNVLINRTIEEQKEFVKDLKNKTYKTTTTGWVRPTSTSTSAAYKVNTPDTSEDISGTAKLNWREYTLAYQRGFQKVDTRREEVNDVPDDVPDDDSDDYDQIEDEIFQDELDDYLKSLEDS